MLNAAGQMQHTVCVCGHWTLVSSYKKMANHLNAKFHTVHHTVNITNAKWMIYTHLNRLYKFARFCKVFRIGLTIDFTFDLVFVRLFGVSAVFKRLMISRWWDYSLLSIATGAKLFDLYLYVLILNLFLFFSECAKQAVSFTHTSEHTKAHARTHWGRKRATHTHTICCSNIIVEENFLRNFPSGVWSCVSFLIRLFLFFFLKNVPFESQLHRTAPHSSKWQKNNEYQIRSKWSEKPISNDSTLLSVSISFLCVYNNFVAVVSTHSHSFTWPLCLACSFASLAHSYTRYFFYFFFSLRCCFSVEISIWHI